MSSQTVIESFTQQENDILRLNNWIFENTERHLKDRTFEMKSGSGDLSAIILDHNIPLYMNDPEKENRDQLRAKFEGNDSAKILSKIDFYSQGICKKTFEIGWEIPYRSGNKRSKNRIF